MMYDGTIIYSRMSRRYPIPHLISEVLVSRATVTPPPLYFPRMFCCPSRFYRQDRVVSALFAVITVNHDG
jgi:hypothetical protein